MNLRDLEYLVGLADHRNFHRAAEACNISQPTLSAQIRKLEDELGVSLFERAARGVIPTQAGEAAIARARRILDELCQLRQEASARAGGGPRRLHIGVFPTLGPYLLPHIVPRFVRRFPNVELLLTEEKSIVLMRRLLDGDLDAALLALPVEDGRLSGVTLFSEPFHLAVPSDHELAGRTAIPPDNLAQRRLMLLEDSHCMRDQTLELCRLSGAQEHDGFRGTSLETLRQMVVAGVGMTLLPSLACREQPGDLSLIRLPDARFRRDIGLFWRTSSAYSAILADTAELIREVAIELLETLSEEDKGRALNAKAAAAGVWPYPARRNEFCP